ncbi:protein AMBP [Varanus komodoensis]|uniref:protein AMBP n=1 Tax=Varanus komodoensis TaxID=61221 RepID=UPI001CF7DB90|nr:protein AMBP [Varanus komodoensis]
MELRTALLCLCVALVLPAWGSPIPAADGIQAQEDFDEEKLYGKWYGIAIGTTCRWMMQYKHRFNMGTLVVAPGRTEEEISLTATRIRQGVCSEVATPYKKTDVPGKIWYYNPRWKTTVESYVVRTDYDEYAIFVMKKNGTQGLTTTAKLYGRSPRLSESRLAEFKQLALGLGIPEDSIFNLIDAGECVPPKPPNEPQRVRRTTLFDDEGSADGPPQHLGGHQEDDCRKPMDTGPCLGMEQRYFYNATSQTCDSFYFGGCMGNKNNFLSERACLQTCRTEAACRLPIIPGGACKTTFWAFDAGQGKCVTFQGCGGNANKFYLEKECKEYCGIMLDGDEEFLRLSSQ